MENRSLTFVTNLLRILLGWYMFADGVQILLTPNWSAAGFLLGAKTFPAFYAWFATPGNLLWVNPLNAWGITLIGVALIIGIGVKPAAWAGAALHIIYYFPHYAFPNVPNGFIVEDHIIYACAFVLIAVFPSERMVGLARYIRKTALGRAPLVRSLI